MKERFDGMSLDQLDAIREVLCYLYPPTESIKDDTAQCLWDDLEEVLSHKRAEYEQNDECKAKKAESDALYASMFQPWKEESV